MDYMVTVCAECLTAVCWHGELMCENSGSAGVIDKKASELNEMRREHPDCYQPDRLIEICGSVEYLEQPK